LATLNRRDLDLLRECLAFVAHTPAIGPAEFQTRLGVDQSEVQSLLLDWTLLDLGNEWHRLAVANAVNEVCNGLEIPPDTWTAAFSGTRNDLNALSDRLREVLEPFNSTA
jgi:hypothetical protein